MTRENVLVLCVIHSLETLQNSFESVQSQYRLTAHQTRVLPWENPRTVKRLQLLDKLSKYVHKSPPIPLVTLRTGTGDELKNCYDNVFANASKP